MEFKYADLIGTPFAYGGRGPDTYDCYGLLMEMMRRQGKVIPDVRSPDVIEKIAALLTVESFKWTECEPEPGCAIVFKVQGLGAHVGFYLGNDRFIHTWEKSGGVCTESLSLWRRRVMGFYRYDG